MRSILTCAALALALTLPLVLGACTWSPWIPGEGNWEPPAEVTQAPLAEYLALDRIRVDAGDCYARRCQKRYRVIVEEPGLLTLQLVPELKGPDAQARIVLEAVQGVLGQASSGRGDRTDVVVLAVREQVKKGTYFVLVQTLGGPVPYEIGATHTPGGAPEFGPAAEPVPRAKPTLPDGPPPFLREVKLSGRASANFDPAVSFNRLRTFSFARRAQAGDTGAAGTVVEQPLDRQIRRFVAETLQQKGFRPATGPDPGDLRVEFSRGTADLFYRKGSFTWYDYSVLRNSPYIQETNQRGRLTIDMIEAETGRIAWHGWSEKGMGPGTLFGTVGASLAHEAVSDILKPFPPY